MCWSNILELINYILAIETVFIQKREILSSVTPRARRIISVLFAT